MTLQAPAPQPSDDKENRDLIIRRLREVKKRLAAGDTTAILTALRLIEEVDAIE